MLFTGISVEEMNNIFCFNYFLIPVIKNQLLINTLKTGGTK